MTTRKFRECAINDRRGRGEGLFRWDLCRSFNLFFEHVEDELLKKISGNFSRLFPSAWIDVYSDPCWWLGARGRKAQRKLHLLMNFFRFSANWSHLTNFSPKTCRSEVSWLTAVSAKSKFRQFRPQSICEPSIIWWVNYFQLFSNFNLKNLQVWSFVIDGRVGQKPSSTISATIDLWIAIDLVSELFSKFNFTWLFKRSPCQANTWIHGRKDSGSFLFLSQYPITNLSQEWVWSEVEGGIKAN